ncbi:MAG: hypothetical protein ACI30I_06210 [Parabacteroides sp.]
MTKRNQLNVVRRGCRNTPALVDVESLPKRYLDKLVETVGDLRQLVKKDTFADRVVPDPAAMQYFQGFRTVTGKELPDDKIQEYYANAIILNAISSALADKQAKSGLTGGRKSGFWEAAAVTIAQMKAHFGHSLPENPARLKEKFMKYKKYGYSSLVSRKFGNTNSLKVSDAISRLVLSIYSMPNKPYASTTRDIYMQFLGGSITVADMKTGEIFDRSDFFNEDGTPVTLSESTIWNIINDPKNKAIVASNRMGTMEYATTRRPHHIRTSPEFSFSKVSLDDRDLPRKMPDGNRVKAYYAYDVASGCVIGRAYSRKKTTGLFVDCIRDMLRFIDSYHFGMPLEMEVEHHIVNQFADDMMRDGVLFPLIRWCNPGNSQEKRAEHFNKEKKYGYEKRYQEGIGRFYARLEANRPKVDKVFDEDNNHYKEKTYTFEELVADDMRIIELYNNDLHRNQKKYPGKTRLQVLLEHRNPNMTPMYPAKVARYVGECTHTSIRRSAYVRVQYQDYRLSSPEVLDLLKPNCYEVDAYYMPADTIEEVYIYQNNIYIDTCRRVVAYNEATAEQTDADREAYKEQAKYVAQYDAMVRKGRRKLSKVAILPAEPVTPVEVKAAPVPEPVTADMDDDDFDFAAFARRAREAALKSL